VGSQITLVGTLSNPGKEGAYLVPENTTEKQVNLGYLEAWKEKVPDGARVEITGTIRYRPALGSSTITIWHTSFSPACYFFDAKESKMRQLK
jgi:hypothetical protein